MNLFDSITIYFRRNFESATLYLRQDKESKEVSARIKDLLCDSYEEREEIPLEKVKQILNGQHTHTHTTSSEFLIIL